MNKSWLILKELGIAFSYVVRALLILFLLWMPLLLLRFLLQIIYQAGYAFGYMRSKVRRAYRNATRKD